MVVRPSDKSEEPSRGEGERRSDDGDESATERAALARALATYVEALQFRRRARRCLRALDLTFTSWRVLEATCRLVATKGDACCHAEVARAIGADESAVTDAMRRLGERGWVSHDVAIWQLGFRVIPTEAGAKRLQLANRAVLCATTHAGRERAELLRQLRKHVAE